MFAFYGRHTHSRIRIATWGQNGDSRVPAYSSIEPQLIRSYCSIVVDKIVGVLVIDDSSKLDYASGNIRLILLGGMYTATNCSMLADESNSNEAVGSSCGGLEELAVFRVLEGSANNPPARILEGPNLLISSSPSDSSVWMDCYWLSLASAPVEDIKLDPGDRSV